MIILKTTYAIQFEDGSYVALNYNPFGTNITKTHIVDKIGMWFDEGECRLFIIRNPQALHGCSVRKAVWTLEGQEVSKT